MSGVEAALPAVSVVVPTCNRAHLLRPVVEALAGQEGVGEFEVIVVDDRSTDATATALGELAATAGIPMRVLRTSADKRGPAAARNVGWRAARAPIIAFTDDDCAPQPGWLAALVKACDAAEVAQGLTEVDPDDASRVRPFARFIVITEFTWKFETCNLAYRRELLERLGGFDESLPFLFGEDVDLGWRATELGARASWAPDAIVYHQIHRTDSRVVDWVNWLRYVQRCRGAALVLKRNPGWRAHLSGRVFYKPYHAYTLGALVALALGRRRPAAGALAAPWLYYRLVVDPHPARLRWMSAALAMSFIADAAEVAATVQGAVRYRTMLL